MNCVKTRQNFLPSWVLSRRNTPRKTYKGRAISYTFFMGVGLPADPHEKCIGDVAFPRSFLWRYEQTGT